MGVIIQTSQQNGPGRVRMGSALWLIQYRQSCYMSSMGGLAVRMSDANVLWQNVPFPGFQIIQAIGLYRPPLSFGVPRRLSLH